MEHVHATTPHKRHALEDGARAGALPRFAAVALAGALLVPACAGSPARDPVAGRGDTAAGYGLPSPAPIGLARDGGDALRPPPAAASAGEAGVTAVAAPAGGAALGAAAGTLMVLELAAGAAAAGPALIVAAPLIPIVGVAGLVAGAEIASAAAARARLTEESRAAIQRAMAQRLSPERLGACLRDTLVARSGGRLTGAEITTPGSGPRTTLGASAAFNVVEPGAVNAADPFLKLALTARLAVTNAPAAAGAEQREAVAGQWTWVGERQNRYLRWAADDGVPLEPEIGLGIGLLARRILGDLYPELRTPVPRSEREREQYRAACRPPERVAQPVSGGG